jgi:hypothetical protein
VTKIRRGGFIFLTWKGDHPPRHVHVLFEGRLVLKWDLERHRPLKGAATTKLLALIRQLEDEGLL